MAKCKKCGEICSHNDKFCAGCGARAPKEIETRCPKCNGLVFDRERFCTNCGKKIDKKKAKKIVIKK